jgi:hypothetical protein
MASFSMITQTAWKLLRVARMGPLVLLIHPRSALKQWGWFRSFSSRMPVDGDGKALPWWTYPTISFLEGRVKPTHRILEYGCGNSTMWLAARAAQVTSLETHKGWYERLKGMVPGNVELIHSACLEEVGGSGMLHGRVFDILIIDAGERITCCRESLQFLAKKGVVLWDNTDGKDWPEIMDLMGRHGFREISFMGMVPQEVCASRTTLFYRDENVLGI